MKIRGMRLVGGLLATGMLVMAAAQANALTVSLEPANTQRAVGEYVRVQIYANNATALISMGVKVTFDPAILQVVDAKKYEDPVKGWVMDADGNAATTADQYKDPAVVIDNVAGTVSMLGGHLLGANTGGLSGKVLLGWIKFQAKANGKSSLSVDRFKYHPNHPTQTFDNFVNLDGSVTEPTNIPGVLGSVCVVANACSADINGDGVVSGGDFAILRAANGKSFPDPAYNVFADINGDGVVSGGDFAILRTQNGKSCPKCP